MNRTRILLVDDHPLFRQGIRWTLETQHDMEVVGEVSDGQAAIQQADFLTPDVIVCDINLPGMNGLEVTRILRRRHPQCAIIVLTMHQDDEQLFNCDPRRARRRTPPRTSAPKSWCRWSGASVTAST